VTSEKRMAATLWPNFMQTGNQNLRRASALFKESTRRSYTLSINHSSKSNDEAGTTNAAVININDEGAALQLESFLLIVHASAFIVALMRAPSLFLQRTLRG
jgi:hypothetical protein